MIRGSKNVDSILLLLRYILDEKFLYFLSLSILMLSKMLLQCAIFDEMYIQKVGCYNRVNFYLIVIFVFFFCFSVFF